MNALDRLDAACIKQMEADVPVTWGFNGVDYIGTFGHRDMDKMLTEGGFIPGEAWRLLVDIAQLADITRPVVKDKITICVNADLIPCSADDAVGDRLTVRITEIHRAGGGLTYTIGSASRG